jgi:hypothetical protein
MTKAFKTRPGYTLKEISRYIPLNNKSILKTMKDKIIQLGRRLYMVSAGD